ncbi:hypothetical protein CHS0354_007477 [Potamilus streckersoni]|uniref:Uncharacterized protein n=1 Tax=Potamilus streckersoni TaxID=2493646 RepID=A0AAE0W3L4_9BIVA|nr:hypothetical protein CHS0354_007477 [Potamilus streckersoni]
MAHICNRLSQSAGNNIINALDRPDRVNIFDGKPLVGEKIPPRHALMRSSTVYTPSATQCCANFMPRGQSDWKSPFP